MHVYLETLLYNYYTLKYTIKFEQMPYLGTHTPISSAIFPDKRHLYPSGQLNPAIPPHSHCTWHTCMQKSASVPAHGLPHSFQFPLASAHCCFVMPAKPTSSSFGSSIGSFGSSTAQAAINTRIITKKIKVIGLIFYLIANDTNFYTIDKSFAYYEQTTII